jgi:hypothetical protein
LQLGSRTDLNVGRSLDDIGTGHRERRRELTAANAKSLSPRRDDCGQPTVPWMRSGIVRHSLYHCAAT